MTRTPVGNFDIKGDNFWDTYTLNIDKALKKKLDATKRQQNVLYKYTKGGLVITADAATFELLRIAANIYYENLQENTKY